MREKIVRTSNVIRFLESVNNLLNRQYGVEGMGILYGLPGVGKTTVVAYAANKFDGIYVRASAYWRPSILLQSLALEMGADEMSRKNDNMKFIVQKLLFKNRVIFVDEADYLLRNIENIDTLRDIYDLTSTPVVLIGMEELGRRIQKNGRFARRITEWIEFKGIDLEDAKKVSDELCEVRVDDDVVSYIYDNTKGNIGRIVTALSKLETIAKANNKELITLKDIKNVSLFYDEPVFVRRGK